MTPVILLNCLESFVKEKTSGIKLQVRVTNSTQEDKTREALVYKMGLPGKDEKIQRIPYILMQVISGKDDIQGQGMKQSICQIRMVVAVYAENDSQGGYDVLNVLLRIRSELEKTGVIGGYFALQDPLEYIVYPDNTAPYYFGEMMTNWSMPVIVREVQKTWQ